MKKIILGIVLACILLIVICLFRKSCKFKNRESISARDQLTKLYGEPDFTANEEGGFSIWYPQNVYDSIIMKDQSEVERYYVTIGITLDSYQVTQITAIPHLFYNSDTQELSSKGKTLDEAKKVIYRALSMISNLGVSSGNIDVDIDAMIVDINPGLHPAKVGIQSAGSDGCCLCGT
jgi:hypothetical protein